LCVQLQFKIHKEIGVKGDYKHWYDHVPTSVETAMRATILRNQQVRTDRTIPNNKPDKIIRGNKQGI